MREWHCLRVALCGSDVVWECRCVGVGVAVCGSGNVLEWQYVGLAVRESDDV